jgi:hypothetical protein
MVIEGSTPPARMEINVPLTASVLSLVSANISGDLTVSGTLFTNELKTIITSASIIYQSGSTKQGDSLDDTHEVTGSLRVFGSISGSLSGSFVGTAQGSIQGTEGLTGSLQRLISGQTYLAAGANISIVTQSSGQVLITASIAAAADQAASYIVVSVTSSLPNERSLSAGYGLASNDNGAGSTFQLEQSFSRATVTSNLTASSGITLVDASLGAVTVCLPNASANLGRLRHVKKIDSSSNFVNVTTINTTQLIDGQLSQQFNTQWTTLTVAASGSNYYII